MHHTVGARFAICWVLVGYLVFRVVLLTVMAAAGWSPPDLPFALLGLALLDVPARRWRRLRWPLAGLAVTGMAVLGSALGISSVPFASTAAAAVVVGTVLVVAVLALVSWRALPALVTAGLVVAIPLAGAAPARAHDPGTGRELGSAGVVVSGDGSGDLDVVVTGIRGVRPDEPVKGTLVARRAGRTVTGTIRPVSPGAAYAGSITVPSRGLWFVYVRLRDRSVRLETWRAVEGDVAGPTVERRVLYVPARVGARQPHEYVAGLMLYAICVALAVWALVTVRSWAGAV